MKKQDFLDYAKTHGAQAAADLLLLCGPDGYDGDYAEYEELERTLNAGGETWAKN